MISREEIQENLVTRVVGRRVFSFESIDSTNACARMLAETGMEEGTVVLADHQTMGRGRLGRSWTSESGTSLLLSFILRPGLLNEEAGILSFYAAVAAARAIEEIGKVSVECKWPNDLLINSKKCGGILLESSMGKDQLNYCVVGIGINVNQVRFDPPLDSRATSVFLERGGTVNRLLLLRRLLVGLDDLYADITAGLFDRIVHDWRSRCTMLGNNVTVAQAAKEFTGRAVDVRSDGGLILDLGTRTEVFHAGDVTVLPSSATFSVH
jgi:BirA family biotin operon repressor/biotin-[acetyl-CoA-carboxylase] ligase